jgi:RNA polymerase sigma-70 factor (ECF subfamily)
LTHDVAKLDLYLSHRAALVDYATPIVGDRMRAEDVVQEAFIRFSAAGPGQAPDALIVQPVGYLYRIVRNLALDWARHLAIEGGRGDTSALEALPDMRPSPERAALYRDELRCVALALNELPPRTRTAFELHRLGGLTLQQVADRLDISLGLTHRLIRDALTHCAERLGNLGP